MGKDPAFLLYSSDFLIGTAFFDLENLGLFIKLLCIQHQHGGRIKKEDFNAIVTEKFSRVREKFVEDEYGFYNKRLEYEMLKRKRDADSSRENGKKGGRPKKTKPKQNLNKTHRLKKQNLTENENINVNEDENVFFEKSEKLSFEKKKEFLLTEKIELSATVLEAAEMNQFTHTKEKNTDFILQQWKIFLKERMNDPPGRWESLSELNKYFLNFIRNKFPTNGSKAHFGNTSQKRNKSSGAIAILNDLRNDLAGTG
jgi:uncharacterized protein YdaU (DUF1376 family)